jgi:hypothetical protein
LGPIDGTNRSGEHEHICQAGSESVRGGPLRIADESERESARMLRVEASELASCGLDKVIARRSMDWFR